MPIIYDERWDSGNGSVSADSDEKDLIYLVAGAANQDEAEIFIDGIAPLSLTRPSGRTIVKQTMEFEMAEGGLVSVTVHYGPRKPSQVGEFTLNFDTTGGTAKITQSKRTINKYAPPGKTAPDFKGAIGVTADGVEGVEVGVSVFKWTETHTLPLAACTMTYGLILAALSHHYNNAPFRVFPAGAVIFRGSTGGKKDEDTAEISFSFEAGVHATGLSCGAITGIEKKAWEYLWVRYEDVFDATAKATTKVPLAAYVEEICDPADFSRLGIGTT